MAYVDDGYELSAFAVEGEDPGQLWVQATYGEEFVSVERFDLTWIEDVHADPMDYDDHTLQAVAKLESIAKTVADRGWADITPDEYVNLFAFDEPEEFVSCEIHDLAPRDAWESRCVMEIEQKDSHDSTVESRRENIPQRFASNPLGYASREYIDKRPAASVRWRTGERMLRDRAGGIDNRKPAAVGKRALSGIDAAIGAATGSLAASSPGSGSRQSQSRSAR